MGSRSQTLTMELQTSKGAGKRGQIIIRAEAVSQSNHSVVFQLGANDINNTVGGCLGMCGEQGSTSFELMREVGDKNSGRFVSVCKSQSIRGTKSPTW